MSKSEAEDPQRSLTEDGVRVVERMAGYLSALGLRPEAIEHSEKLRARQTAEILAARLNPRQGTKLIPGMAPNDDIAPMAKRLQAEEKSVMLVGHLPYLSHLLSALLGVEQDRVLLEFQMGGVVRLGRIAGGEWRLRWVLTPDLLVTGAETRHAA